MGWRGGSSVVARARVGWCEDPAARPVPGAKAAGLTRGKPTDGAAMAIDRRIRFDHPPDTVSPAPLVGFAVSARGLSPGHMPGGETQRRGVDSALPQPALAGFALSARRL